MQTYSEKEKEKLADRVTALEENMDIVFDAISTLAKEVKQHGKQLQRLEKKIKKIKTGEIKVARETYTTRSRIKEDITIDGEYEFEEEKGSGVLEEVLIKSPTDSFSVKFLIDGELYFDGKTYTFLNNNSEYLTALSAYADGGYYYVNLREVWFQESFSVRVSADSTTFDLLSIKYRIHEGE